MIEAPNFEDPINADFKGWEDDLNTLVSRNVAYSPPEMYWFRDRLKAKYYEPYFPEKESEEQSVGTAIRVKLDGESKAMEVSRIRPRLKPLTHEPVDRYRYYVPKELEAEANRLRAAWDKKAEVQANFMDCCSLMRPNRVSAK